MVNLPLSMRLCGSYCCWFDCSDPDSHYVNLFNFAGESILDWKSTIYQVGIIASVGSRQGVCLVFQREQQSGGGMPQ
jgi:hypothetical protein